MRFHYLFLRLAILQVALSPFFLAAMYNIDALQKKLSDLVQDNNFQKFAAFREEFVKKLVEKIDYQVEHQLTNKEVAEQIQEEINDIFSKPIKEALEKKYYGLAYCLIKESSLNASEVNQFGVNTLSFDDSLEIPNINVDILSYSKDTTPILKSIIDSQDISLIILAESLIAKLLKKEFTSFQHNPTSSLLTKNIRATFDNLEKTGLSKDKLKKIITYVLININRNELDTSTLFHFMQDEMKTRKIPVTFDLQTTPFSAKVELILSEKAAYNAQDLIQYAQRKIWAKDSNEIIRIIEEGANINVRDVFTENTLLILALQNSAEAAKLLLQFQADTTLYGAWKQTPLMVAAIKQDKALLEEILNQGAQSTINAQDILGKTALILLIENIIENRAPYKADGFGKPNITSVENAQAVIEILIKNGADVHIKDVFGKTALDYAQKVPFVDEAIGRGLAKSETIFLNPKLALQSITNQLNCLAALSFR